MDIKAAAAAYSNIAGIAQNNPVNDIASATTSATPSFSDLIAESLNSSVEKGHNAEKISTLALMGKSDLTQLVAAVGDAEQALQLVVTVRDKMISAYQQISQMPM